MTQVSSAKGIGRALPTGIQTENNEEKPRLLGQQRLTTKSKNDISKGRERFSYSQSEQDN